MKLKKLKNRLLTLMAAAAVTLSAVIPPAGAATVTFHNEKPEQPDLYVHKTVTSAVEGYDAPEEDTFTFVLTLNGEPAKNVEYDVKNSDGTEVKPSNGGVFKTGRDGSFQLKADQTARFIYVGSGVQYVVTERTKDNYQQTLPEGGPAVGTVESDGTQVDFNNLYIPPDLPPDTPDAPPAVLTVTKSVRYPAGYQMPAAEAEQEFSFKVSVDGEDYVSESYEVTDRSGEIVGHGTTDGEGRLTLKGGQTAKFSSVPAGVDYEVTELVDENGLVLDGEGNPTAWYQTASDNTVGATGPVITPVSFTNTNAAFLVTKKVTGEDHDPETDFTFRLLDGEKNAFSPAADYYLYDAKGELVEETPKTTKADGTFTLKDGQAALFVGIPAGTAYSVQEEQNGDYTQVLPEDVEGYVNKVVSPNVEKLPFENHKEDWKGTLVVRKTLKVQGSKWPNDPNVSFRFRLEEKNPGDADWKPCADLPYTITPHEHQTDSEGVFTLKKDQSAVFENLPPKTLYRVSELWQEMKFGEEGAYQEYYISPQDAVKETELAVADTTILEFVNSFDADSYDIRFTKTDASGHALAGAKFSLYADENCTVPLRNGDTYTSGFDGSVYIPKLKRGTYYLLETEAPNGYRLLGKPLAITIESPDTTLDGKPVTMENETVSFKVVNKKEFALPITGGFYPPFIIVGALTIVMIALLVYNFRFQGRDNDSKKRKNK